MLFENGFFHWIACDVGLLFIDIFGVAVSLVCGTSIKTLTLTLSGEHSGYEWFWENHKVLENKEDGIWDFFLITYLHKVLSFERGSFVHGGWASELWEHLLSQAAPQPALIMSGEGSKNTIVLGTGTHFPRQPLQSYWYGFCALPDVFGGFWNDFGPTMWSKSG